MYTLLSVRSLSQLVTLKREACLLQVHFQNAPLIVFQFSAVKLRGARGWWDVYVRFTRADVAHTQLPLSSDSSERK